MEQDIAAIIGAGLIGRAWAMVFARAGWQRAAATTRDRAQLDAARGRIAASLAEQQAAGLVDDAAAALARIASVPRASRTRWPASTGSRRTCPRTSTSSATCSRALDAHAPPDAVLASSTSAIPASQFTEALAGRARCLVAHPVNPPHLVPVVELCGAPWTSPATIERRDARDADVGQVPVVVRREIDGFILNRLQGALLSEAMRLVGEGYVSPRGPRQDGRATAWACAGRSWGRSRRSS